MTPPKFSGNTTYCVKELLKVEIIYISKLDFFIVLSDNWYGDVIIINTGRRNMLITKSRISFTAVDGHYRSALVNLLVAYPVKILCEACRAVHEKVASPAKFLFCETMVNWLWLQSFFYRLIGLI